MLLEIKNVSKTYVQAHHTIEALKDISFSVAANETVSIVGSSGSGKSTLLSLIAGLDQPTAGQIVIHDQDVTHFDENQWADFRAQHIGIVFQDFHLMAHLSALENVMLPLHIIKKPDAKGALALLDSLGLADRAHHLPSQLSGGERQRVAIARACVTRPSLLIADEPSGNLDTDTGEKVMDHLFSVVAQYDMTFMLVTHDKKLAGRCGRGIELSRGAIKT